jgi:hypothetical protein
MSFFIGNRLEKSYFHNRRLSGSAACGDGGTFPLPAVSRNHVRRKNANFLKFF